LEDLEGDDDLGYDFSLSRGVVGKGGIKRIWNLLELMEKTLKMGKRTEGQERSLLYRREGLSFRGGEPRRACLSLYLTFSSRAHAGVRDWRTDEKTNKCKVSR
jgi:hypothetical protein